MFTDYDQEASWYNVVGQFYTVGPFLQGISIITLVFYFVTSSDSGSLVVDTLAANGRDEQNPIQRLIWAVIEGLVATGLVVGGSANADSSAKNTLKALQAASICCGLPFTFMLCFMMPALWYGLQDVSDPDRRSRKHFSVPIYGGIFDSFEWFFSFGACSFPSVECWCDNICCLILPFMKIFQTYMSFDVNGKSPKCCGSSTMYAALISSIAFGCYLCWLIPVFHGASTGFWGIAWACYVAHAGLVCSIRQHTRNQLQISGNIIEDFFSSFVAYPMVLYQCELAIKEYNDAKYQKRY